MQNAKDSFYESLRSRLATLNPERSILVRGITRPGVLVDENETENYARLPDCFHLCWKDLKICTVAGLPLLVQGCEITYATAGTSWNGGLDRGRALAAMDAELMAALQSEPHNAAKFDYTAVKTAGAPKLLETRIWWSHPEFGPTKVNGDELERSAVVEMMSYQEAGES
jgi:hypothetical protein